MHTHSVHIFYFQGKRFSYSFYEESNGTISQHIEKLDRMVCVCTCIIYVGLYLINSLWRERFVWISLTLNASFARWESFLQSHWFTGVNKSSYELFLQIHLLNEYFLCAISNPTFFEKWKESLMIFYQRRATPESGIRSILRILTSHLFFIYTTML